MNLQTKYRVYITPRLSEDTYADEATDVSDRVQIKGLQAIKSSIDAGDYDIGAFTYSDVSLTCSNSDGFFNDFEDTRSMFPHKRDLAKVQIVFLQQVDMETITFRGIINDEATKINVKTNEITFKVLSRDSVIKKSQVAEGAIPNGVNISEAIFRILNVDEITRILTVDQTNIVPASDLEVELGSGFDEKNARDAINELLLASNSVLFINEDDEVIVQGRDENEDLEPLLLWGQGDLKKRENIIDVANYNLGLHRVFNSVTINGVTVQNLTSITAYGFKEKEETYDWLDADVPNITAIANAILNEFSYPKIEMEVRVETYIAKDYDLLDRVSLDYPLNLFPPPGKKLPFTDIAVTGDTTTPTPFVTGAVSIDPRVGFKIIEKKEEPKTFTTILKLRQIGTTLNDGML